MTPREYKKLYYKETKGQEKEKKSVRRERVLQELRAQQIEEKKKGDEKNDRDF